MFIAASDKLLRRKGQCKGQAPGVNPNKEGKLLAQGINEGKGAPGPQGPELEVAATRTH